ncbi:MAG TPA: hypothetical protein PKL78_02315 [Anaerolineales bacterium]|nr:hypothetical protein [Anaerolineales bacterium]
MKRSVIGFEKILAIVAAGVVVIGAWVEVYNVAWGTGTALGSFSMTWFALFILFTLLVLGVFSIFVLALFSNRTFSGSVGQMVTFRERSSFLRWVLILLVLVAPIWFLQRTMWGVVFDGGNFRMLLWALTAFLLTALLTRGTSFVDWKAFLAALILTSGAFTVADSLQGVTDYPFSLGWSEGNRIWDYSIRFGRDLYNISPDQDIYVLLDSARMLVGGLPFLIPGVTIEAVRLWVGLTLILPYFLVGLAALIVADKNIRIWLLMTLWVFLFLRQGPIHAPLVLAAALTVFLWRKPLWLALPLVAYAGFYAQSSRFTWLFAPGIWIGMLELAGASLRDGKLDRTHWVRAIALGVSGVFGGYLLPKLMPLLNRPAAPVDVTEMSAQIAGTGVNSEFVANAVADQPLLWYRLLPNPTYGNGILLGLLIAVLPVAILLVWLAVTKKWNLNVWQILAIVGPLIAFFGVGLVASTKIGGGGDLHNMDMFLIGVAFTVYIAWVNGGREIILSGEMPTWARIVLVAALVVPAIAPLRQLRSFDFGDQIKVLQVLTDTPGDKTFDMLPSPDKIEKALGSLQQEVDSVQKIGEVLFIDQRQLLTFGYVQGVRLIPEYEKKVLMNEAMSTNAEYFASFYRDITSQRFALIVTEPLRKPVKDSSFEFGEENNAWVEWVSIPVLCYYEEVQFYKGVNVQVLAPRESPEDCAASLPPQK